jgi:ribosomal protein S9
VASTNECTPLVPKAGDSLTYSNTMVSAGTTSAFTTVYDYSGGSYSGKSAIVLTETSTISGKTTTAVVYLDPVTGAVLGNGNSTETTITSYDPADYETRLRNAVSTVGQSATVNVKARISGTDITNAFSAIGGGTALNIDYTFTMVRMPNETIATAGSSYNTCKLKVDAKVNSVTLEGGNASNPLYGLMFSTLSAVYAAPINTTVWMSNQVPHVVKTTGSFTVMGSTATSTTTLTAVKLAGR